MAIRRVCLMIAHRDSDHLRAHLRGTGKAHNASQMSTGVHSSPPVVATLDVRGLRVTYDRVVAVAGIDLEVHEGEIFGLLGPNGAGKTSALSAIEGLLQPDQGVITIGGVDARTDAVRAKARMGVQLQSTSFHSDLTILEIVRLFAGLYGVVLSAAEIRDRLADINLDDAASQRFRQLSGGQQQRLSLLIATIHRPPLVLLDEPTAGLDPQARRQLWGRIESLRDQGHSILLTTHSMEEAQAVCDRVAIMDRGRIVTVDTPAGLIEAHMNDPRVRAVAHGPVTLEDVFIGLTGGEIRD